LISCYDVACSAGVPPSLVLMVEQAKKSPGRFPEGMVAVGANMNIY
jgi:hypothetical protein